jgi:hypothetical protein
MKRSTTDTGPLGVAGVRERRVSEVSLRLAYEPHFCSPQHGRMVEKDEVAVLAIIPQDVYC